MKRNVFNCHLKKAREVAVMKLVGRLFHARAAITRKEWSPTINDYSIINQQLSWLWQGVIRHQFVHQKTAHSLSQLFRSQSCNVINQSHKHHVHVTVTHWLAAWHSVRTSVFGRRTFPVLRLTCSWWVTTYVGKPSAIGQPTRPTQPFIPSGSIDE